VDHNRAQELPMLKEEALLYLNGKVFCAVSEIRLQVLREVINQLPQEEGRLVFVSTNGIQFSLKTNLPLVKKYVPVGKPPNLTNRYETPPPWFYRVPEGTTVYWDDGTVAGSVRQYFTYQSETAPGDSTWCEFISELFSNEQLCFKLKDIEVLQP